LSQKTPIRYPGDRPNAQSVICAHVPASVKTVCSPFLTGGSIELRLARRGKLVRACSHNIELVQYWACAAVDPVRIANVAKEFRPLFDDDEAFYDIRDRRLAPKDPFVRAGIFYAINRSTEDGTISCGKLMKGHPKLNELSLLNMSSFAFSNLYVHHVEDFSDAFNEFEDAFFVCCPYTKFSRKAYLQPSAVPVEKKRIDHLKLHNILINRDNWLLLYDYSDSVKKAYAGHKYKLFTRSFKETDDCSNAHNILIFANNL
jgi:DNA adenine methylase